MKSIVAIALLVICEVAIAGGSRTPSKALVSFAECRRTLPLKTETYVEAKCAGADPAGLVGSWHKGLVESIGYPSWCLIAGQMETDGKKCFGGVHELGYSYYVMPTNTVGGGPELSITLDKQGQVVQAKWVYSQ